MRTGYRAAKFTFINSLLILISIGCVAQAQSFKEVKFPEPKRFIDKIEVFAGPNLSLNHGNMFIENYFGEYADENYVLNERQFKAGYLLGVGIYHPLTSKIDINVRLIYEKKGTKNELNNPLNPVNDDTRLIHKDNYTYSYITIEVMPTIYIGVKKRCSISFGGYYSRVRSVDGVSEIFNTRDYQVVKGTFEGRYFYHLRDDGGIDGVSWQPFLTGIEDYDWGFVSSIGYNVPFTKKHSILIQLQDNFGLRNINKNNAYSYKEKNHSLSLIFSYTYHLPTKSSSL